MSQESHDGRGGRHNGGSTVPRTCSSLGCINILRKSTKGNLCRQCYARPKGTSQDNNDKIGEEAEEGKNSLAAFNKEIVLKDYERIEGTIREMSTGDNSSSLSSFSLRMLL